jgi:hypothetical protein
MKSVYSAVRTGALTRAFCAWALKGLTANTSHVSKAKIIIKDDFEVSVIRAINRTCPDSVIAGCNFHFAGYKRKNICSLTF